MRRSVPAVESKPSAANAWALWERWSSPSSLPCCATAWMRVPKLVATELGRGPANRFSSIQHTGHAHRLSTADGDKVTMARPAHPSCLSLFGYRQAVHHQMTRCRMRHCQMRYRQMTHRQMTHRQMTRYPIGPAIPQTPSSADLRRAHHALTGVPTQSRRPLRQPAAVEQWPEPRGRR